MKETLEDIDIAGKRKKCYRQGEMLYTFLQKTRKIVETEEITPDGLWYDLVRPKTSEREMIEKGLNLSIPTQEEMGEIEASSRLYEIQDTLFMTSVILAKADSPNPFLTPITFILNSKKLITVRYADPKSFQSFKKKVEKLPDSFGNAEALFLGLLESIVDRVADILEKIGKEIDAISKEIFILKSSTSKTQKQLDEFLTLIGQKGDLTAKARECLVSLGRLLIFFNLHISGETGKKRAIARVKTLQRDVSSITDHVTFLLNKISFLLDATLGYINIEQNGIIKIFSVAAVVFLPPTVIASIYGMNFKDMPELHWVWGYPFALLLMIASGLLPYLYFKSKRWL